MKRFGMIALSLLGFLAVTTSHGSVPPTGKASDDTVLYQGNSQITAPRVGRVTFDQDLKNLNQMEHRYQERLPRLADRPELASPIKRISAKKYHPTQRAGRAPKRK